MSDIQQTIKSLGVAKLAIMGAVFFSLIVFFVFLITRASQTEMEVLYSDLAAEDAGAIGTKLTELGIVFAVSPDGSVIQVEKGRVGEVRLALAAEGLPSGGAVGYEIFDQDGSLGMSADMLSIKRQRALQGELQRTIEALEPVRQARVHLVFSEREAFSTRRSTATATVTLTLRSALSGEQVTAIQHLVAAAVPDLDPAQVSVFNNRGMMLSRPPGDEALGGFSDRKEEQRRGLEQELVRKIERQLMPIVGPNRVAAEVTLDMNWDRITESVKTYDPEGQIALSVTEQTNAETENETEPQETVGVGEQLPGADQGQNPAATSNRQRDEASTTTNFVISSTDREVIKEVGTISRLNVSVLVDGIWEPNADGVMAYRARTDEEMAVLREIVRNAIGFDDARNDSIRMENVQFQGGAPIVDEDTGPEMILGFERDLIMNLAETVVLGLVAILVVLLVVRPMMNKVLEVRPMDPNTLASSASEEGMTPLITHDGNIKLIPDKSLEAKMAGMTSAQKREIEDMIAKGEASNVEDALDQMINVAQVEGRVRTSSLSKISELVEKHPEEAVGIVRNWMYQES